MIQKKYGNNGILFTTYNLSCRPIKEGPEYYCIFINDELAYIDSYKYYKDSKIINPSFYKKTNNRIWEIDFVVNDKSYPYDGNFHALISESVIEQMPNFDRISLNFINKHSDSNILVRYDLPANTYILNDTN